MKKFFSLACAVVLTGSCMPIVNISTGEILTPESFKKMHHEMTNNSIDNSNPEEVREGSRHYDNFQEWVHNTVLDLEIKLKNFPNPPLSCSTEDEASIFGYRILEEFYKDLLKLAKYYEYSNKK